MIKAMVLVGIAVSCLMGCFRAPPQRWTTAPLERPIEMSTIFSVCPCALLTAHLRGFLIRLESQGCLSKDRVRSGRFRV